MLTGAMLDLLTDTRLSADARVLGVYIGGKGEGFYEIPRVELAGVLSNEAGPARVRRAMDQLVHFAWVERRAGGRGHADSYRFRVAENDTLKDRVTPGSTLNAFRIAPQSTLKPHQLEEREIVVEPPISPLNAAFEKHGEAFVGFRDSMRDYVSGRVPEPRQAAYVHTVAGWLNDIHPGIWQKPDGGWLPKEARPALLAAAFNDLAAGDERTMKRPVGDPGNLQTKISILIKQWVRANEQRSNGTDDRRGRTATQGSGSPVAGAIGQASRRRRGFGAED